MLDILLGAVILLMILSLPACAIWLMIPPSEMTSFHAPDWLEMKQGFLRGTTGFLKFSPKLFKGIALGTLSIILWVCMIYGGWALYKKFSPPVEHWYTQNGYTFSFSVKKITPEKEELPPWEPPDSVLHE